jgi:predicted TIM-barrel fold metal-dependent hydrolase
LIIDMHVHPFCKEANWSDLDAIADVMWGLDPKKRKVMRSVLDTVAHKVSIDDYINLMDKFNIDKAVIVAFDITTAYGVHLVTNADTASFMKRYPDRFIGFACIDVPAANAME